MLSHRTFARLLLVAAAASGAVLLGTGAPVNAQPPPPNCTAADLSVTMSGITAATGTYLFTHPQVNEFFTSLGDVPAEEKQGALKAYMDSNPQVTAELNAIQQPATDFENRCGIKPGSVGGG